MPHALKTFAAAVLAIATLAAVTPARAVPITSVLTNGASSGTPVRATATASKGFANTTSAAITLDMKASNVGSGGATVYTVTQTFAVPEPASAALLAIGIVSLALARRRARRVDPES